MSDNHHDFSVKKLWIVLLALTAVEVIWGYLGNQYFYEKKLPLWGGLLLCAYWKGYYILMYFMHIKYEGMIVKGNILFTIPLVCYLMIMITPDTVGNHQINYGIADQLDPVTGHVSEIGSGSRNKVMPKYRHAEYYEDIHVSYPEGEGGGGH